MVAMECETRWPGETRWSWANGPVLTVCLAYSTGFETRNVLVIRTCAISEKALTIIAKLNNDIQDKKPWSGQVSISH